MGDGLSYRYRNGKPPVLLGEVRAPLWDAHKQWDAVKSAFSSDPQERLKLVPFGPRLGLIYTAHQLDPATRSAVNPSL